MQSELHYVRRETIGRVGVLSLDHPKKLNALSERLVRELIDGMKACVGEGLRVVILRAMPGIKVWSAGHDVSELPEGRRDPLGWSDPLRELVRTIETLQIPVIAMVEGSVWGGAMETVMACDIIIAEDKASFAVTPARLGVPYNTSGMMTFLNAAPLHAVKEMIFTARPVSAERAIAVLKPDENRRPAGHGPERGHDRIGNGHAITPRIDPRDRALFVHHLRHLQRPLCRCRVFIMPDPGEKRYAPAWRNEGSTGPAPLPHAAQSCPP